MDCRTVIRSSRVRCRGADWDRHPTAAGPSRFSHSAPWRYGAEAGNDPQNRAWSPLGYRNRRGGREVSVV